MDLQKLPLTAVPFARKLDDSLVMTESNEHAGQYLARCLATHQPLAVVTDPGGSMSTLAVRRFLQGLDEGVTVIRVERDKRDNVLAAMQQIIRGVGFDPADLNLADLESVLLLFLQHQRTKDLRTIISFDSVGEDEPWLLYYMSRLLTLEADNEFGLLVIVAGQPAIGEQLRFTMMQGDRVKISEHFDLAPLREAGTLELLRHEMEACGAPEVGSVFEFDAVTRVHELSGGVPDTIGVLCQKSLELACQRDSVPVSAALVQESACSLGLVESENPAALPETEAEAEAEARDWFIINDGSPELRNVPFVGERAVIGRGSDCDIQIEDNWATREHALLLRTKRGILIVDLLSTNGTYVRSKAIIRHCLQADDIISIGTSELTYRTEQPEAVEPARDQQATHEFEIPVLSEAIG